MTRRRVRNERWFGARRFALALLLLLEFVVLATPSWAQGNLGPVTVGAGLQTGYTATIPASGDFNNQFALDHARIYISGPVYEDIKFMFNTEYDSVTNKIGVLDAVAQIAIAPQFNLWIGRFLPPSDRANLYGPFYSNQWGVYTDGIQDGYPAVFQGRDNGVMYWGDFAKKVKVSVGGFDGGSATGKPNIIGAARVQIDFWDPEDGYYLNGTYYGDKNLLAIGGATQFQDGHTATTVDFLMEKKVGNGGAFTIESEFSDYNRFGGYEANYAKSQGEYGLASYLFPKVVPIAKFKGKFEILGKYAKADFTLGTVGLAAPNYDQKTTEVNFNYIIKQFNARVMTFFRDTRFNRLEPNFWQAGIGLQIQM
jgi:hypothetical protein